MATSHKLKWPYKKRMVWAKCASYLRKDRGTNIQTTVILLKMFALLASIFGKRKKKLHKRQQLESKKIGAQHVEKSIAVDNGQDRFPVISPASSGLKLELEIRSFKIDLKIIL